MLQLPLLPPLLLPLLEDAEQLLPMKMKKMKN
jgi:hypothetical protein